MVSIYDFNPTKEEIGQLFLPELSDRSKEDYLKGRSQKSLYRDIAALFWIRGEKTKAKYYLSKTWPQMRADFLNLMGGF